MKNTNTNRDLWVGFRPSVIPARKNDKKKDRKDGKRICRDALKGVE